MRSKLPLVLEMGRLKDIPGMGSGDGFYGAFAVNGPTGMVLRIISSGGEEPLEEGWEHVSVSCGHRCPSWEEMSFVKNLFWDDEETVLQFHPKKSSYINCHPFCLHLWRHRRREVILPPAILVGPKGALP